MRLFFLLLGLSLSVSSRGQLPEAPPTQVYAIQASLDDSAKLLDGTLALTYTHQGPDTLLALIFHVWANAFSTRESDYTRQGLETGNVDAYFLTKKERIRYQNLAFSVNGQATPYHHLYDHHPDIVQFPLDEPLQPGQTITIDVNWQIFMPSAMSRMGYDGQIWQWAHWFPKIARHDHQGWHPMPYLDLGEFFQDFAQYRVSLDLPDQMSLISTGMPADEATENLRAQALERSLTQQTGLPATPAGRRTWNLQADWVTDFAWAASTDFLLQARPFNTPDGRTIIAQSAFTPDRSKAWNKALDYVERSTLFYDKHVGPYPWPQVSAVQGVKGFSGGMEYPMLTFIQPNMTGSSLDNVITHEVGHNWFYGILATNERAHSWQDEGLNSYYEYRYMREYHDANILSDIDFYRLIMLDLAHRKRLPPITTPIESITSPIDYGLSAYNIPTLAFRLLADQVGEETLDKAFQNYYRKYGFGHPSPANLRTAFEEVIPTDISWLFDQAFEAPLYRDMKIKVKDKTTDSLTLRVSSKYLSRLPFRLDTQLKDSIIQSQVFDGFYGKDTTIILPLRPHFDHVSISDAIIPDLRHGNHHLWLDFPHRYRDWRPGFMYGVRKASLPRTYILPQLGYNSHDGFQTGVALHNQKAFYQTAGFYAGTLYGWDTKRWNYHGAFYHDIYPGNQMAFWRVGLRVASFSYLDDATFRDPLNYNRWMPFVEWASYMGKSHTKPRWKVGAYAWLINQEIADLNTPSDPAAIIRDPRQIFALRASYTDKKPIHAWSLALDQEYQSYATHSGSQEAYLKTGLEATYQFQFLKKRKLKLRAYGGFFPYNTRDDSPEGLNDDTRGTFNLAFQSFNDYRFEETFLGRNTRGGIAGGQILIREGGFKTALGAAVPQGQSNRGILALNVQTGLPVRSGLLDVLELYADLGYWATPDNPSQGSNLSDQLWMDAGLALNLFNEHLMIYVPLVQNKNLRTLVEQVSPSLGQRVTWTFRFNLGQLPLDIPSLLPI